MFFQAVQPYTGKILACLVNGLSDRNVTVKKTYAAAIGNLVKAGKDSSIDKLGEKFTQWYFEKDGK